MTFFSHSYNMGAGGCDYSHHTAVKFNSNEGICMIWVFFDNNSKLYTITGSYFVHSPGGRKPIRDSDHTSLSLATWTVPGELIIIKAATWPAQ